MSRIVGWEGKRLQGNILAKGCSLNFGQKMRRNKKGRESTGMIGIHVSKLLLAIFSGKHSVFIVSLLYSVEQFIFIELIWARNTKSVFRRWLSRLSFLKDTFLKHVSEVIIVFLSKIPGKQERLF